jgi:hypothetical protein
MPSGQSTIILSYRREDSAGVTGRIFDRLVQEFGTDRVFMDIDSMPAGVDFHDHLQAGVQGETTVPFTQTLVEPMIL